MANNRGYILLETIIAVLILSIGVIALSRALMVPAKALDATRETVRAYRVIDEKFGELRGGLTAITNSQGTVSCEGAILNWTVKVGPQVDRLRTVTVQVCWDDRGEQDCLALTSHLLDLSASAVSPEKTSL